jgi:lipopolysaccharide/colanic/teichoic acid biosynthesis glycosyltransferase
MYRLNSPRREPNLPMYERVMQHLSVTELPQLLNVLRGEMSLVGPRPEVLESVRHYTDWHLQRLNVKPGITGLAQVHGLRDQNALEDKTRYDLQYILHRSLFQDISLVMQTIWTIIRRLGHLSRRDRFATT